MLSTQYHSKVPKYLKLSEELRQQIQSGALLPGARLPSVAEIQAQHGVSLSTIDKAHALLEQDGLIVREQGRGTFVAQSAKPRTTRTLGLVLHKRALTSFYMMELLAGIHGEASRQNLEMLWLNDDDISGGRKVDAVLMCCDPTEALVLNLPTGMPHMLLFQHCPDFTCIAADDFNGLKAATQYLLESGHRRIAYLPSSNYDSISRQRMAGHFEALKEAGLQPDEKLVKVLINQIKHGYRKSGELTMTEWLEHGWSELDCTAILAHNDEAAIGVIRALHAHGLRVPDDVSVVGFDGTELSELSTPSLTTVKVPLHDIAATAVKILSSQMEKGASLETQKIILPTRVQLGGSTAPIKSRDGRYSLPIISKE